MFKVLARVATLGLLMMSPTLAADQLDPANPMDALAMARKIQCSTVDDQPITYWWHGKAYARRMGEPDKLLFLVEGMNVRRCGAITDEKRGKGYELVSREILLYKDAATGEVLSTWENPWTGEVVDVLHVANDPVNFKQYEIGRDGKPMTLRGTVKNGEYWQTNTFPLFYSNPLGGDYQGQVGARYHATEMFNFFASEAEMRDPSTETVAVDVGWARMSDWLPWMNMQGREGIIYMHTAGLKLNSWDELSDTMKEQIATHYPEYTDPPPLGDDRRNMTSWKYFRGVAEGKIATPDRK